MNASWLGHFCLWGWCILMGATLVFSVQANILPTIPGLLLLVGGLAGMLSLFIPGQNKGQQ